MAAKLLSKLEVYIKDNDKKHKKFRDAVAEDIEEKLQVPGGASLLATVGYVYRQEAIKFTGGFLGIGGVVEGAKEVRTILYFICSAFVPLFSFLPVSFFFSFLNFFLILYFSCYFLLLRKYFLILFLNKGRTHDQICIWDGLCGC